MRSHLHLQGRKTDEFLAIFGIYVLNSTIFDYLNHEIKHNIRYRGEFQLTTCLDQLSQYEELVSCLVKGQYFDIGMPEFYRQTLTEFPGSSPTHLLSSSVLQPLTEQRIEEYVKI